MTNSDLEYNDLRILITGATGLIGSMLIKRLLKMDNEYNLNISIIAVVRDIGKARQIIESEAVKFIVADVTNIDLLKQIHGFDYIVHCAATTKSADISSRPVETADGIILGTKNIIELAKMNRIKSMVYLSSMEVYGVIKADERRTREETLGEIDILNVRSCYPLSKRMAENYCISYCKEYKVPIKIARLAQVFGTGILKGESRVFAQFANSVRNNEDIVMHTDGSSMGNYVDIDDAIDGILLLLFKGKDSEVYNIVNEDSTMKIKDMAQLVADKVANGKIKVSYDITEDKKSVYASDTGLMLSSSKIEKLGWHPKVKLEDMYINMIKWMDENNM